MRGDWRVGRVWEPVRRNERDEWGGVRSGESEGWKTGEEGRGSWRADLVHPDR